MDASGEVVLCRRGGTITAAFLYYTDMLGYTYRMPIEGLSSDKDGNITGTVKLWEHNYTSLMTHVRIRVVFEGGASKTMTANNFMGIKYEPFKDY